MKKQVAELQAFKKKVQDDQAKEAAKFQEKIDAMEDTEYKKTLEETKETVQKEKDEIKKDEEVKKTLEYVHSFGEKEKSSASEGAKEDDTDKMISDNLKTVGTADEQNSAENSNDNSYHDDNQAQLDEKQTAIMVLKAIADSQSNLG